MLCSNILKLLLIQMFVKAVSAFDFYRSLSLSSQSGDNYPTSPWTATIGYEIPVGSVASDRQYTLTLQDIYRVIFTDYAEVLPVNVDGVTIMECTASQGAYTTSSILDCRTLPAIEAYESVTGSIDITVTFHVGGSDSSQDIEAANKYVLGDNTITWGTLSTVVTFDELQNARSPYNFARTTGYGSVQNYYLFPSCDDTQSGWININYGSNDGTGKIECDAIQTYTTNNLNSFLFPKSFSNEDFFISCNDNSVSIYLNNVPAGYQFWTTVIQQQTNNQVILINSVNYDITCGTENLQGDFDDLITIVPKDSSATVLPLVATTTPWSESFTSVTTVIDEVDPTGGTIIVYTPIEVPTSSSTSEDPTSTSEDPSSTSEDPTSTSEDPSSTSEDPSSTSEDPSSSEILSSSFSEETCSSCSAKPTSTIDPISSTSSDFDQSTTTTRTLTWDETFTTTVTRLWTTGDRTITIDVSVPAVSSESFFTTIDPPVPVTITLSDIPSETSTELPESELPKSIPSSSSPSSTSMVETTSSEPVIISSVISMTMSSIETSTTTTFTEPDSESSASEPPISNFTTISPDEPLEPENSSEEEAKTGTTTQTLSSETTMPTTEARIIKTYSFRTLGKPEISTSTKPEASTTTTIPQVTQTQVTKLTPEPTSSAQKVVTYEGNANFGPVTSLSSILFFFLFTL